MVKLVKFNVLPKQVFTISFPRPMNVTQQSLEWWLSHELSAQTTVVVAEAFARECLSLVIVAVSLLQPFRCISSCKSTLRIPAKSRDDGWCGVISALFLSQISPSFICSTLSTIYHLSCFFFVSLYIVALFLRDLHVITCNWRKITSMINFSCV